MGVVTIGDVIYPSLTPNMTIFVEGNTQGSPKSVEDAGQVSAVGGEVLGDDDDHGQLVVDGEVAVEDIEQPPAEGLGVGEVAEVDGEARYADHRQHHRHQAQQDLHTPSPVHQDNQRSLFVQF